MGKSLYQLAEEIIEEKGGDDYKREWLKHYLADPLNEDSFMAELLKKELSESVKKNKNEKKTPPKIC